MNDLENSDIKNWDHLCIVCGKFVDHGGGPAHVKAGARMRARGRPLWIEMFNKDPMRHLKKRRRDELNTQISHPRGKCVK